MCACLSYWTMLVSKYAWVMQYNNNNNQNQMNTLIRHKQKILKKIVKLDRKSAGKINTKMADFFANHSKNIRKKQKMCANTLKSVTGMMLVQQLCAQLRFAVDDRLTVARNSSVCMEKWMRSIHTQRSIFSLHIRICAHVISIKNNKMITLKW